MIAIKVDPWECRVIEEGLNKGTGQSERKCVYGQVTQEFLKPLVISLAWLVKLFIFFSSEDKFVGLQEFISFA